MLDALQSIANIAGDPAIFTDLLELYGYPLVYLGAVFLGEFAIISAFLLSGQEMLNPATVFLLGVLGTLTADTFWYTVGRCSLFFFKHPEAEDPPRRASVFFHALHTLTRRYLILTLLGSKFIIGGRLLILLYIARAKIHWLLVALFDTLGVMIFVAVLAIIGWSSGKGIGLLVTDHVRAWSMVVIILLIVLILVAERLMRKRLFTYLERRNPD